MTHGAGSSFRQEGTHEGSNARGGHARHMVSREAPVSQSTRKRREGGTVNGTARTAHEEGFTIKVADD